MKKTLLASMLTLALVGCGSDDDSNNDKEANITPPTTEQSAPAPMNAQEKEHSEMLKSIHQGIYLLKEAQDPNLNEVLDRIDMLSADGNLDYMEAKSILDLIQKHALQIHSDAQAANAATPSKPTSSTAPSSDEDPKPNPFEQE